MIAELPDDATGDAIRRMINGGSDMSQPHEIDFHVAALDPKSGERIMAEASVLGFKTRLVEEDDADDDAMTGWTVWCTKTMVPTYAAITAIEIELDTIARKYGGWVDGWGAFSVP